jgi:hypothetical protein
MTFLHKNPVERITYPRPLCRGSYGHFIGNTHGHFVGQAVSKDSYRYSGSSELSAVEKGTGMKPKTKNKTLPKKGNSKTVTNAGRAAELTALFLKTPEMQECKTTAGTLLNQLDDGDTVSLKIELPRALVQLAEFLERKRAEEAGVAAQSAAKVLGNMLRNDLHDELHWLTVGPAHFAYYRNLWNRFCDAQGAPEQKIADPGRRPERGGEEGPF